MPRRSAAERFADLYTPEPNTGCWLWTSAVNNVGYGLFWVSTSQKTVSAHRFAYEMHVGPIPVGLVIDHKCSQRSCINPDHLQCVTQRDNMRRSMTVRLDT